MTGGLTLDEAKDAIRGGARFGAVYPTLRNPADGESLKAFFVFGETARERALGMGYDTEQCPTCSAYRLRKNGTCKVCDECGTTTGCS